MLTKLSFYRKALTAMHLRHASCLGYMPEYVAIEVTNVCNFKCDFCPQSDPTHHDRTPKTYLGIEECEFFLRRIREAGIRTNLMHWTLDGEPFMHKGFSDLVTLSSRYDFTNTHFASNGLLCTPEVLRKFPLDTMRMNIAIDFAADPEYFEDVRGTLGSWEVVRNNIDTLSRSTDLQSVRLEITDISSFRSQSAEEHNRAFNALQKLFSNHDRIIFRTRTFHNATGFFESQRPKGATYHLCPYPWTQLRIASNGNIVVCCRDLEHRTVLGNLREESIPDIWNGAAMQHVRESLLQKSPSKIRACAGCDLPYDDSKFKLRNILRAAVGRMQLFSK